MNKLVLVDGHAILHRAFHALPPNLTTPDGEIVNAVYGFMTMLLKVLTDLHPSHLCVTFDLPQANFRQQLYTQYQHKRPEMDGNLSSQIPLVHELLEKLNVAHFEVGGFEADDVIGTLAGQAAVGVKGQGSGVSEIFIVTGDRDMLQLVNEKVRLYVPVKGMSEIKIYDLPTMVEEFGVHPSQWVDVKALKGDSSDNYPGVAGVGPKTALELIQKYGTLEKIYENLGEIAKKNAKLGEKLAVGAENAGMGKKLATIVCDVPVHLDLSKSKTEDINWAQGIEYMVMRLGFKSIPERIRKEILKSDDSHVSHKSDTSDMGDKNNQKKKEAEKVEQIKLI